MCLLEDSLFFIPAVFNISEVMSHPALLITCYYEPVCITDKMDLAKYKHANQVFFKKNSNVPISVHRLSDKW